MFLGWLEVEVHCYFRLCALFVTLGTKYESFLPHLMCFRVEDAGKVAEELKQADAVVLSYVVIL